MNSLSLDKFSSDFFYSEALQYWYYEWIITSNDIKSGLIGVEIVNIRTVLLDLTNEYELNQFKSNNNRKVYIKLIEKFMKVAHLNLYKNDLSILKESLEIKDFQKTYVFAKELSQKFAEENFTPIIYDRLFVILKKRNFSKKDRVKIKNFTKDIIIELVALGRHINDISNLLSDVFKIELSTSEESKKNYSSDIPMKENEENIDNFSVKFRLKLFRNNLIPIQKDYQFIFPVWGMISPNTKNEVHNFLGISIYSPIRERKFKEMNTLDEKFSINAEDDNDDINTSKCNVILNVKAVSRDAAKKSAEEKYLFFLKLANLDFATQHKEFYWDGQYIGKEMDITPIFFSSFLDVSRNEKVIRRNISKQFPARMKDNQINQMESYSKIFELLHEKNMFIELNSLINVIDLMYKSIWETDENKLLNYWICLESLASISKKDNEAKFTFIKQTLSNLFFIGEQFKPVHYLFRLLDNYAFSNDNKTNIPMQLLFDVGIYKSHQNISLIQFRERMHELLPHTKNERFLDEIENTLDFYNDNKKALEMLQNKKNEVMLTIDYIYKSRNQIVHNGYIANNLIPYLVSYAEGYAKTLLEEIIKSYLDNELNLQNYFIKVQDEKDLLENNLSSTTFYDIQLQ